MSILIIFYFWKENFIQNRVKINIFNVNIGIQLNEHLNNSGLFFSVI